jgi:two-component system, sensor histidine kinase and response regulator
VQQDAAGSAGASAAPWADGSDSPGGDGVTRSLADRLRERHAGRRVLVVEDDKVNQMVMLELLGDVGLLADTADDGQDALDRVGSQTYALVAMDLRMPRLDGLGATRALRAMPALDHTPIIAVTANAFEEDRAACRAVGMNDFIPKPIDVDRLYAVLLHWLDRSPVGRPPAPAVPAAPVARATPAAPSPAGIDPALMPLLGLEGIDALGGLGAVGGRVATYRRLLGVFIDAHQGDGQALGSLLRDDEAEAAGRLAHRLRGSAATLGLVDVETAAAGLESSIDRGDRGAVLAPWCDAVQQALTTTVPALRTALAI